MLQEMAQVFYSASAAEKIFVGCTIAMLTGVGHLSSSGVSYIIKKRSKDGDLLSKISAEQITISKKQEATNETLKVMSKNIDEIKKEFVSKEDLKVVMRQDREVVSQKFDTIHAEIDGIKARFQDYIYLKRGS